VETDSFNGGIRELTIKKMGVSSESKTLELSFVNSAQGPCSHEKKQTFNTIKLDGAALGPSYPVNVCFFHLTYDSVMEGRNRAEESRLRSLRSVEKRR
jgi:hypothetical protein